MSNWLQLGHDSQKTSTDLDGNITSIAEVWNRKAVGNSLNGWAGGAIADSSSIYYFYSTYYPNAGGTGDKFSLIKYNKDGGILWGNNNLGGHNCRNVWPSVSGDNIYYHDYRFERLNIFTGAGNGGYLGQDTYGNMVFNTAGTKMFCSRVAYNEGFQGWIWVRAFDITTYPDLLFHNQLWSRLEADSTSKAGDNGSLAGAIVYDNSKIYYAPQYTVSAGGTWANPSGIYCWNEAGVQQWFVAGTPLGYMSAGSNRLYLGEGAPFTPNSTLNARSQTDGSVIWSAVIPGIFGSGQPPVVVGSLVIVASTTMGVRAFDSATGAIAWTAPIAGVVLSDGNKQRQYTMLAAAATSNTLVVTAIDGIYVLDLTDGSTVQFYSPPSLEGRPINPIIVGNRVYITDIIDDSGFTYFPQRLICLENGATPPPTDVTPPTAPGNPTFSSVTTSSMTVSWTGSTDAIGVAYYNLFYRQSSGTWNSIIKTTLSHSFTGLLSGTTYEYYVNAVDAAGNTSTASATTSQATTTIVVDSTIPSTPGNPTFSNVTDTSITVSWTGSTDNVAVSYYRLYWRVAGGSWGLIDRTTLSYTFTGLTAGITYEFYVAAVDTSGNFSTSSATTSQTTTIPVADTTSPSVPGNPFFSGVTETAITVSWTAATDNVAISYYNLYWRPLGGVWSLINKTGTTHTFTGLTQNTSYEFYLNAVDTSGNTSLDTPVGTQTTSAVTAFTQISGTVTVNPATGQRTVHNLTWSDTSNTMALQRKTQKTAWGTIYTGNSPYSYIQTDLNTNYYYRILLDGITPSNQIILRSTRK